MRVARPHQPTFTEQLSPHKCSIAILLQLQLQLWPRSNAVTLPTLFLYKQGKQRLAIFILNEIRGVREKTLAELLAALRSTGELDSVAGALCEVLGTIDSPDALCDFMTRCRNLLKRPVSLDPTSACGLYIRRFRLASERLTFSGISRLFDELQRYKDAGSARGGAAADGGGAGKQPWAQMSRVQAQLHLQASGGAPLPPSGRRGLCWRQVVWAAVSHRHGRRVDLTAAAPAFRCCHSARHWTSSEALVSWTRPTRRPRSRRCSSWCRPDPPPHSFPPSSLAFPRLAFHPSIHPSIQHQRLPRGLASPFSACRSAPPWLRSPGPPPALPRTRGLSPSSVSVMCVAHGDGSAPHACQIPDLPRAYFLRYLNCLHHYDVTGAIESLHRYFDYSAAHDSRTAQQVVSCLVGGSQSSLWCLSRSGPRQTAFACSVVVRTARDDRAGRHDLLSAAVRGAQPRSAAHPLRPTAGSAGSGA